MDHLFSPFKALKEMNDFWEGQANEFIQSVTNNDEFIKMSKVGTDTHARFLETFNKNQEFFANQFNLPTKKDITKVAKLSVQTEEKIDSLEEQVWKLQDSIDSSNKDFVNIIEVSQDVVKLSKQLKTEMANTQKELTVAKELNTKLQEIKDELSEIKSLKEEVKNLKNLLGESHQNNAADPNKGKNQEKAKTK